MNSKVLGKRFKILRDMLGFTQTEVAEQLGVTQTYITRLENGNGVNSDFLIKILSFYGQYISIDRLLNENISIHEIMQEELATPTSELIKARISLMQESVNKLLESFKAEQNDAILKLQKYLNTKIDVLNKIE